MVRKCWAWRRRTEKKLRGILLAVNHWEYGSTLAQKMRLLCCWWKEETSPRNLYRFLRQHHSIRDMNFNQIADQSIFAYRENLPRSFLSRKYSPYWAFFYSAQSFEGTAGVARLEGGILYYIYHFFYAFYPVNGVLFWRHPAMGMLKKTSSLTVHRFVHTHNFPMMW